MDINPYEPPRELESGDAAIPGSHSREEQIRREHIGHETFIRWLARVFLVIGLSSFGGIVIHATMFQYYPRHATFATVALVWSINAIGLLRLRETARIFTISVALLGLLAIPWGTLISPLILYLLLSRPGFLVFSKHYKRVIAATPHIHDKLPRWAKFCFYILLLCLGVEILRELIWYYPAD